MPMWATSRLNYKHQGDLIANRHARYHASSRHLLCLPGFAGFRIRTELMRKAEVKASLKYV